MCSVTQFYFWTGTIMDSTNTILVIGHRNPDTDTIASAVGYAWLLNKIGPDKYVAGRAGKLNAQTAFAVDRFQDRDARPCCGRVASRGRSD